jgi:hypothetical protein
VPPKQNELLLAADYCCFSKTREEVDAGGVWHEQQQISVLQADDVDLTEGEGRRS